MKKIGKFTFGVALVAGLAMVAVPMQPAAAAPSHHHSHNGGGHWHGGGGHWRGGHHWGGNYSIWLGGPAYGYWPGPGYFYGPPYYYDFGPPYYDFDYYDTYAPPPQPDYVPVPAGPAPQENWYHCDNPQGYYPYVQTCASGWKAVPATPPANMPDAKNPQADR